MSCLEIVYRREALVSLNVAIYFLAKEEYKTVYVASADSLGLGVSHVDRKLFREKTQGKPWGFFKTEHLLQSSAKAGGDTVYAEAMRSLSSSRVPLSFPYPPLPVFAFYRPRAAQVRVKARAGWLPL